MKRYREYPNEYVRETVKEAISDIKLTEKIDKGYFKW